MVEPTRGVGVGDGEVEEDVGEAFRVRGLVWDDDAGKVSCAHRYAYRYGLDERIEKVTHTSIQNMDITVLGLSRDHFSTENEQFTSITTITLLANRCNGVRRPLQHLVLCNLLPLGSQRARTGVGLGDHDPINFPEDQTKNQRMWRTLENRNRNRSKRSGVGRELP
jgi:hypothetical protein